MIRLARRLLPLLCSIFLLSGCLGKGTSPTRYYLLQEIEAPVAASDSTFADSDDFLLQVGPINMPRYLDRPQIVSRSIDNRLEMGEFDRWSEPLPESFTRVLSGNLGRLLATDNILIYPNRIPADGTVYQLRVDISRFDGSLGDNVVLDARWTLVAHQQRKVMPLVREHHAEAVAGDDYPSYVAALNRLTDHLSRAMAKRIRSVLVQ